MALPRFVAEAVPSESFACRVGIAEKRTPHCGREERCFTVAVAHAGTRGASRDVLRGSEERPSREAAGDQKRQVWSKAASGLTLARATVGPGDPRPKVARSDRNKTGVGSDPALCLSGDVGFDSCSGFREIMGGGGRLWGTAARELTGAQCRCVPAHSGPSPRGRGFC